MSSLEDLNKVLTECATALDSFGGIIRDSKVEPVRENVRKIGHALMDIFEIQQNLFNLKPELKPKGWDDPLPASEYRRMFGDLVLEVEDLCEKGNALEAVQKLESFIFIGPGDKFEEMARNYVEKIRRDHGV